MEREPPYSFTTEPQYYSKKEEMKMCNFRIRIGKMFWYPIVTLYHLMVIIGVLALVWFGASMVEIFFKNMNPDAVYSTWNYFTAIVR